MAKTKMLIFFYFKMYSSTILPENLKKEKPKRIGVRVHREPLN